MKRDPGINSRKAIEILKVLSSNLNYFTTN